MFLLSVVFSYNVSRVNSLDICVRGPPVYIPWDCFSGCHLLLSNLYNSAYLFNYVYQLCICRCTDDVIQSMIIVMLRIRYSCKTVMKVSFSRVTFFTWWILLSEMYHLHCYSYLRPTLCHIIVGSSSSAVCQCFLW